MKLIFTHSRSLMDIVVMVHLWHTDADKAFGVEWDGPGGGHDGSARLCWGAEIPPRPHLHLPGPGLHTICHLPHCKRGSWEGTSPQRHHDHDGTLWHRVLVREKRAFVCMKISVRTCFLCPCDYVYCLSFICCTTGCHGASCMLLWWPPCPSWCPLSPRTRPCSLTVTSLSSSPSSSSMEYHQWVELWWRESKPVSGSFTLSGVYPYTLFGKFWDFWDFFLHSIIMIYITYIIILIYTAIFKLKIKVLLRKT